MTFIKIESVFEKGCKDCGKTISPTDETIKEYRYSGVNYRCLPCGKLAIEKEFEKLNKLYAKLNDEKSFIGVIAEETCDTYAKKLRVIFDSMYKKASKEVLDKQE